MSLSMKTDAPQEPVAKAGRGSQPACAAARPKEFPNIRCTTQKYGHTLGVAMDLMSTLRPAANAPIVNATITVIQPRTRQEAILRRLAVPCTPSEIAARFEITSKVARAYCYQLRKQGKAVRLDRRVPKVSARGRQWEYLWMAA